MDLPAIPFQYSLTLEREYIVKMRLEPANASPAAYPLKVITVNHAPGAIDVIHRHHAHAVVYVLDGEVEMQVGGARFDGLPRAHISRIT
jgi:quercetin dioxygenase-like cupin family protein